LGISEQAIVEDRATRRVCRAGWSYALDVDNRTIPLAEAYCRAKENPHKALELDESVPSAHASLAWTLFIYDWQWDEAEREFRRAIALNPRYASAHQWFAFLLAARGQFDAALLEAHTAIELDPASVSARRALGWVYYYARRYDQAREHLARAIEMNPMAVETYRMLGSIGTPG
jgi:serine/threonine-protein kinase